VSDRERELEWNEEGDVVGVDRQPIDVAHKYASPFRVTHQLIVVDDDDAMPPIVSLSVFTESVVLHVAYPDDLHAALPVAPPVAPPNAPLHNLSNGERAKIM
jgi:hypothetical protein